jgi:hypothetical protein
MVRGKAKHMVGLALTGSMLVLLGSSQALSEDVMPDGWDYELFADVKGIQNVSGPSSSTCPVGAYGMAVDELGYVYLATSNCNTGHYWVIRVGPDGSDWASFGSERVPDLDGVFARTSDAGEILVYASGDGGVSKFSGSGTLLRRYGGVSGNGQWVVVNSLGEIFASTIYSGILKIDPDSGAVSRFFEKDRYSSHSAISIDQQDNLLVKAVNRSSRVSWVYRVSPDGEATLLLTFNVNVGVPVPHPSGDIYLKVGNDIRRYYEKADGTLDYEAFATISDIAHLTWVDEDTLLLSQGALRKIYTLTRRRVPASVNVDPDVINVKSRGRFVTCYIELAEGYLAYDVEISSILLNDSLPAETSPFEVGDYDLDGVADLMVKFDRQSVQDLLPVAEYVEFKVSGSLADGTPFEGTDRIWVRDEGIEHTDEGDPSSIQD